MPRMGVYVAKDMWKAGCCGLVDKFVVQLDLGVEDRGCEMVEGTADSPSRGDGSGGDILKLEMCSDGQRVESSVVSQNCLTCSKIRVMISGQSLAIGGGGCSSG